MHKLGWSGEATAEGADAIELEAMIGIDDIARVVTTSPRPVMVTCHGDSGPPADVHGFDRLAMAGVAAVVLAPHEGADFDALAAGIAESGVSVVVDVHGEPEHPELAQEFIAAARLAGIDGGRIVVDRLGPIVVDDHASMGRVASALIDGAPLVRSAHVPTTRRVVEVVARLSQARADLKRGDA